MSKNIKFTLCVISWNEICLALNENAVKLFEFNEICVHWKYNEKARQNQSIRSDFFWNMNRWNIFFSLHYNAISFLNSRYQISIIWKINSVQIYWEMVVLPGNFSTCQICIASKSRCSIITNALEHQNLLWQNSMRWELFSRQMRYDELYIPNIIKLMTFEYISCLESENVREK